MTTLTPAVADAARALGAAMRVAGIHADPWTLGEIDALMDEGAMEAAPDDEARRIRSIRLMHGADLAAVFDGRRRGEVAA